MYKYYNGKIDVDGGIKYLKTQYSLYFCKTCQANTKIANEQTKKILPFCECFNSYMGLKDFNIALRCLIISLLMPIAIPCLLIFYSVAPLVYCCGKPETFRHFYCPCLYQYRLVCQNCHSQQEINVFDGVFSESQSQMSIEPNKKPAELQEVQPQPKPKKVCSICRQQIGVEGSISSYHLISYRQKLYDMIRQKHGSSIGNQINLNLSIALKLAYEHPNEPSELFPLAFCEKCVSQFQKQI